MFGMICGVFEDKQDFLGFGQFPARGLFRPEDLRARLLRGDGGHGQDASMRIERLDD